MPAFSAPTDADHFSENLRSTSTAGSGLSDIVKITVFLADIREYHAYNAVRNELFANIDPPPAGWE